MAMPQIPRVSRSGFRASRITVALVALGLGLSPGLAQALTAAEVWSEMQRIATESGQTPRAASERGGDGTLTLEGVTIAAGADAGNRTTTLIDSILLTENADGSVGIAYQGAYQIVLESSAPGGLDRAVLDLQTSGLKALATGTVGDLLFQYDADEAALSLSQFAAADRSEIPDFQLSVTDLSLTSRFVGSQNAVDAEAANLSFVLSIVAPDGAGQIDAEYRLTSPTLQSTGNALALSSASSLEGLLASGVPFAFEFNHSGMALGLSASSQGVSDGLAAEIATGTSRARLADGAIDAAGSANGLRLQAVSNRLPAPLSASADTLSVAGMLPVVSGTDSVPVSMEMTIEKLTFGDEVWQMIDPGENLPRDPARLQLDLDGVARFSDSAGGMPLQRGPVLDLEQLTINNFALSAAGALLEAEGAAIIDRARPGPLPGMPALIGRFGLAASGAEALMTGLAGAGILQPSDAMGLRMMLGMLARPGTQPDTLTSEIELRPDGSVVANGMQLR